MDNITLILTKFSYYILALMAHADKLLVNNGIAKNQFWIEWYAKN